MAPQKCEVCVEAQSKYKCPSCLIPYCSLACFKKHKETPCAKPEPVKEEQIEISCAKPEFVKEEKTDAASHSATNDDKPCYVNEQRDVLQESQLHSVASSNEICDSLKDEKLRKLILNIDSSAYPENDLDKAMEDEEFRLFTEKILSTISP